MKPQPLHQPRPRAPRRPGPQFKPVPFYRKHCGFCGRQTQVVTDGRMLVCGECGH